MVKKLKILRNDWLIVGFKNLKKVDSSVYKLTSSSFFLFYNYSFLEYGPKAKLFR